MSEISRSDTLRENERIKHWTGALSAWGNALVIGNIGQMLVQRQLDLVSTLGLVVGIVVLWIASVVLTLLVAKVKYERC